jgi:hypothetical protein
MRIHDYIVYRYDGKVYADYEHRTTKTPQKNYGTGTTHYQTVHKTGKEACAALIAYCEFEQIAHEVPTEEWYEHFSKMDDHVKWMMGKKDSMSEEQWKMAFSCDAPNHPGYYRANND